jgi:hypothetical protein
MKLNVSVRIEVILEIDASYDEYEGAVAFDAIKLSHFQHPFDECEVYEAIAPGDYKRMLEEVRREAGEVK